MPLLVVESHHRGRAATLSATLQDLGTYATMLVNVDSNLATDSYNAMSQNGSETVMV